MLFSVLMSVYDKDDAIFLDEALQSIYTQVRKAEQVVVVLDGPVNDNLKSVVDLFKDKFFEIGTSFKSICLPKNVGLGMALVEGCKHCDGDYIVRMDSDDISISRRLEYSEQFILDNPEVDVFGGQIEEFKFKLGDQGIQRLVPLTQLGISKRAKLRNPFNHVTVCIKRSTLEDVGGYEDVLWHEDYYLWLKFISNFKTMANMPHVLVNVRIKGFGDRRGGFTYLKAELSFLRKAIKLSAFNIFDSVRYLFPRFVIRLLPSYFIQKVYRFLRK